MKSRDNKSIQSTAAVFDLDNTITKSDTYISILLLILFQRPQRMIYSLLLPCAVLAHKIGLKDNTWLKKTFLKIIAGGATLDQIDEWAEQFVLKIISYGIYPEALKAIEIHKKNGHRLIMATASFDFYVLKLAEKLGFDEVVCTQSSWDESNRINGEIDGKNCYGDAKLMKLKKHFGSERNQWYIIGYSDHHSDTPMLEWVDQAIAINPTKKLRKISGSRNYVIKKW